MKKLLITGSNGFIGSNLLQKISFKKFEVHTLSRNLNPKFGRNIHQHILDINQYSEVTTLIDKIKPQYVVHLAGVTTIKDAVSDYLNTAKSIYVATVNLAEACRGVRDFKQFLMAGSSKEYGFVDQKSKKIVETTPLLPNNPYGIAKVAAEKYLAYLNTTYKFPYTIMRTFTTYGRINNTNFFIEKTIHDMLKGSEVQIIEPDAIRDWIYIDDTVEGYLHALGNKNAIGEAFNLCSGTGHTVMDVVNIIRKFTNSESQVKIGGKSNSFDPKVLIGSNLKAFRLLGWKPMCSLEKGLDATIRTIKASTTYIQKH